MASTSEVYINVEESGELNINVGEVSTTVEAGVSKGTVDVPVFEWKKSTALPPLPHPQNSTLPSTSRVGLTLDEAVEYELKIGRTLNPDIDEKLLRRTISNRLAAKRSRIRRMQRVFDLEKKYRDLREAVNSMNSQMEALKENQKMQQEENVALKTAIVIRANSIKISEGTTEEYQRELRRLKELMLNNHNQDVGQSSNSTPYSNIDFYEQRLKEINHFPAPAPAPLEELEPDSLMEMIDFDDDEGVDQYLNLDGLDLYLDLDVDVDVELDRSPSRHSD